MEALNNHDLKEKLSNLLYAIKPVMELFEGYAFHTSKGLRYHYKIKGNEIFFSRKEKSVTRAIVDLVLEEVLKLQESGVAITGTKKLGRFGGCLRCYIQKSYAGDYIVSGD